MERQAWHLSKLACPGRGPPGELCAEPQNTAPDVASPALGAVYKEAAFGLSPRHCLKVVKVQRPEVCSVLYASFAGHMPPEDSSSSEEDCAALHAIAVSSADITVHAQKSAAQVSL